MYTEFWGHLRKRPLGRSRLRRNVNIKMDLAVMGCEDGTGWGPCPIPAFGFSSVEPLVSVTTVLSVSSFLGEFITHLVGHSVSQSCSNSWTKALSFHAYTVSRDLYSLMHELARFRYLRPPKVLPVIRMSRMVFTSRQEHIPYVPYHKLNSMKHSWSIEQQQEAGSLVVGPRDEQFISGTGSTNMNKLMRCRFKIETNRKFLK